MTMVRMNSLCEAAVAGRSRSQREFTTPHLSATPTWNRPPAQQERTFAYERVELRKPEASAYETATSNHGSVNSDAVHPLSLPYSEAIARRELSGFERRGGVDICELPPLIEYRPVRCMSCGVHETSVSSACCKKCDVGINGVAPKVTLMNDLEFLHTLKQESRPGSRKRIRAGHALTLYHESLGRIPTRAEPSASTYRQIVNEPQGISPDPKRRRRHDEWTRAEIVILLQCTKLLIDCELKCVSQALYHFTSRKPGKCYGRAAEKKLKRLEVFENWRKCNKDTVIARIDLMLRHYGAMEIPRDILLYCEGLKATSANRSLALAKALINAS